MYEARHEKTCLCYMRTTKVQISLRVRAVRSAALMFADRWYNIPSFYIRNFKTLASFCSWAGPFESYLVANPEDRFSRDGAQLYSLAWPMMQWRLNNEAFPRPISKDNFNNVFYAASGWTQLVVNYCPIENKFSKISLSRHKFNKTLV